MPSEIFPNGSLVGITTAINNTVKSSIRNYYGHGKRTEFYRRFDNDLIVKSQIVFVRRIIVRSTKAWEKASTIY